MARATRPLPGDRLPAFVQLGHGLPGLLMARGRAGAGLGRGPCGRLRELVLDRAQRRLGGLDLLLECLVASGVGPSARADCASCWACASGRRTGPGGSRFGRRRPAPWPVPRAHAGTRASHPRSCAASRPRSRSCASRSRRAAPDRGRRAATSPGTPSDAASSASRLSRSRWLVGSSRTSTLAPEWTRIASDSRRRSPPDSPSSGFSRVLAGEQEAAQQRARLAGRQARRVLGRLEHGAGSRMTLGPPGLPRSRTRSGRPQSRCELLGVLREVAELDVVAGSQLALGSSSRRPGQASRSASSCRSRWRRRATRARRARATARRRRAAACHRPTIDAVLELEYRRDRCAPEA